MVVIIDLPGWDINHARHLAVDLASQESTLTFESPAHSIQGRPADQDLSQIVQSKKGLYDEVLILTNTPTGKYNFCHYKGGKTTRALEPSLQDCFATFQSKTRHMAYNNL